MNSDGRVDLNVVNEKGEPIFCGHILSISSDGYLIRDSYINKKIGLALDERGKIKER